MTEETVFTEAMEIADPKARAAFLDRACSGNPDVRVRVDKLLAEHAQAGSFLGCPAPLLPTTDFQNYLAEGKTHDIPAARRDGTAIGPYKLVEVIGEGGMGTVWLAQQQEPVKRLVALKVIKAGMDSKSVLARFEAERQALALMDHPNIAKVLDAGASPDGRPYFVMELVKGVPITKFCDERRLTPRQRLELFVPVCQAVQHAHQKGVIHRDLKPSNVLVALYDGRPVPKVIDFGIAKAAGQPLTEKTLVTGLGTVVGTPEYMSPEQAELNQLDIDTRSDIYSLGILLYELLTGTTPLQHKRVKEAALLEVLRLVREEEPPRPSTRLSTTDELPSIAACRGTEPGKLSGLVRGELDWIVMKALEKDRGRRYETANGFGMDVQRYLAGEAVQAVPPSAGYQLRKFARRNKGSLAAAGALLLLLLGTGAFAWHADRQSQAREREERVRFDRNAEAAAALLDQCEEALRADRADRAAIALEAAEKRAEDGGSDGLADRLGRCRADLQLLRELNDINTLRWSWTSDRGPDKDAARIVPDRWRKALLAYGVTPDADSPTNSARRVNESLVRNRVLAALDLWLAGFESSVWLRATLQSADPDQYRDQVRNAWAARDSRELVNLAGRPEALDQPAWFAAALGNLGTLPADRRKMILESALWSRPWDLALLMELGGLYPTNRQEATGERVRWYQAAVAAHPESVPARNNLGVALRDRGDLAAAAARFREALRLEPTFALGQYNLGVALRDMRDQDGASMAFQESIRLNPNYASAHYEVGLALYAKGDKDGAIEAYRRAIQADRKDDGAHNNLGAILYEKHDFDGAMIHFKEAIQLAPTNALHHRNLGNALKEKRELDGAVAAYNEAIRLDPKHAPAHYGLGTVLLNQSNSDGAIASFREAIRADPDLFEAHFQLGSILFEVTQDFDGAITHCSEAVRLSPTDAMAHCNLGSARSGKGDRKGAIAAYLEAIRLDPNLVNAHFNLASVLQANGDIVAAISRFQEAIRISPSDVDAHNRLALLLAAGPDRLRDGRKAVELAAHACELTEWKDPGCIATLAAAHAETGDFDKAVQFQTKALSFPDFEKVDGKGGRERLDLYERKMPYRDPGLSPVKD